MKTIEQFYEQLKTDPELQQKLAGIGAESKDGDQHAGFERLVPILKEEGYSFTYEELETFAKAQQQQGESSEMSLDELDAVAGGGNCFIIGKHEEKNLYFDFKCVCVFVGVSKNNVYDRSELTCFLYGQTRI